MEHQNESAASTLTSSASAKKSTDLRLSEGIRVIEWEDFEQEVARLWSLSSALKEAQERKQILQEKLQPLIQVGTFLVLLPNFNFIRFNYLVL